MESFSDPITKPYQTTIYRYGSKDGIYMEAKEGYTSEGKEKGGKMEKYMINI